MTLPRVWVSWCEAATPGMQSCKVVVHHGCLSAARLVVQTHPSVTHLNVWVEQENGRDGGYGWEWAREHVA